LVFSVVGTLARQQDALGQTLKFSVVVVVATAISIASQVVTKMNHFVYKRAHDLNDRSLKMLGR
jgi:Ca2+/H+ antiporter